MTEKELFLKVAERVKELRTEKGMSQQELAGLIDFEKSNMSRFEAGGTNPTIATLYKIAQALDVTLSELLMIE
ncbi:hypothetical protein GCM10023093_17640 [Nemorincola caseinilytica]|uniref:HTH cro/C1-type domain-containing protein n=1 Tax=Nemorincola caseinilytica TaxID=2054315 RepID=A0ABP8NDC4_9BACT